MWSSPTQGNEQEGVLTVIWGRRGKYRKFIMGGQDGISQESFFEMKASVAAFQHQMILNQKPGEIDMFPWDSALTSAIMMLTSAVKKFEIYWWKFCTTDCIVKKSEKERTLRQIIQEFFFTRRKDLSPCFLVCYIHQNVACFILSLCHFVCLIWALARKCSIDK